MAGSRSLFAKALIVFEVARRANVRSVEDLLESVRVEGLTAFEAWVYDAELDQRVPVQSVRSIRRAAALAETLGLVTSGGSASRTAVVALGRGRLDDFLGAEAWRQLEQAGLTRDLLIAATSSLRDALPGNGPSARSLFAALAPNCSFRQFSGLLSVLGATGGLIVFQRRMYFVPTG